MTKMKTIKENH